tara:strand:- start:935 stop:1864 length:930 start_codon:yes stop_codon:yes gene_type:complete
MYPDNNWYGHRYILNKYCNCLDKPIFATLQHGWISDEEAKETNVVKRKLKLAPFLSWNSNLKKIYPSDKKIIPIGAPFLYLNKIMNKLNSKTEGTIFFPSHSVPIDYQKNHTGLKNEVNHYLAIEEIQKTAEPPYTVSLYDVDFKNEEIKKIYKDAGWKVISFGSRENVDFLNKVYEEIYKCNLFVCSDYTSALFYAIFLKKKVRYMNEVNINNKKINLVNIDPRDKLFLKINSSIINNIKSFVPEIFKNFAYNNNIYDYACNQLGYSNLKEVDELKKIIGIESKIKTYSASFYKEIIKLNHTLKYYLK